MAVYERKAAMSPDKAAQKPDMWSSLLNSVASGRRLPEKNIVVLGGNTDTQKEFLESFSQDTSTNRRLAEIQNKWKPPIANHFALGYTYHDVLDADHEDILARISVFLLAQPITSFASLLRPLLTPDSLSDTMIVILLDWTTPWNWLRELRKWIQLLEVLLSSLDNQAKIEMERIMTEWREKKRGSPAAETSASIDGDVSIPLGPGEWDAGLGLPLCVVCQNADKIEALEKERSWKEDEFDYVLQTLRTVLLKHGGSLIYTSPNTPSALQTLIHSTIGISSPLRRESLKHNVIDRDKVLVPPNWDSWGKIRVLREGFDVESVSSGWMNDIASVIEDEKSANDDPFISGQPLAEASAIAVYEAEIKDPSKESQPRIGGPLSSTGLEVESMDSQEFLAGQLEILGSFSTQDAAAKPSTPSRSESRSNFRPRRDGRSPEKGSDFGGRVNDHIGPVQFNMGGIQVDADDMLSRLKERESERMTAQAQSPEQLSTPESKAQNDALNNFFKGLIKRHPGSAVNSPRSEAR